MAATGAREQRRSGIGHKVGRAFALQAMLIGLTAVLSVYAARIVIADVLIRQALEDETEYFLERLARDPDAARPDTRNLTAWLVPGDAVPAHLSGLPAGFHKLTSGDEDFSAAFVSQHEGRRLVLAFDGERVSELAVFFGIVPLAMVLVAIYLATWLAWRFSRRAISPIIGLAGKVAMLDPATADPASFDAQMLPADVDHEVVVLSGALRELVARAQAFVERERNFTRDASHELRSPITVIRLATDVLQSNRSLDERARVAVDRIRRSAINMEELIETLLLLARESEQGLKTHPVLVNEIVVEEIERARHLLQDKPVTIAIEEEAELRVEASDKVLAVLLGNLIRNACAYTNAGSVVVRILGDRVEVADSGIGMSPKQMERLFEPFERGDTGTAVGHGVGLTIVKRLSDRFGWPIDIRSETGAGTSVVIRFPAR